jgi:hypothetical protein
MEIKILRSYRGIYKISVISHPMNLKIWWARWCNDCFNLLNENKITEKKNKEELNRQKHHFKVWKSIEGRINPHGAENKWKFVITMTNTSKI